VYHARQAVMQGIARSPIGTIAKLAMFARKYWEILQSKAAVDLLLSAPHLQIVRHEIRHFAH
jgi:hypothetical protein